MARPKTDKGRTQTVSVILTENEMANLKEAAHRAGSSNSAWIAQRLSLALFPREAVKVRDFAASLPLAVRKQRASGMLTHAMKIQLETEAHALGMTAHAFLQAIVIRDAAEAMGAAVALRPDDEPVPVSKELRGRLQQLHGAFNATRLREAGAMTADQREAMRERVAGMAGRPDAARMKALDALPRHDLVSVYVVAGWLILEPWQVLAAAMIMAAKDRGLSSPI